MSAMILRWRIPDPPVKKRWRGSEGMLEIAARRPADALAAVIGLPGATGPAGPAAATTRFDQASPAGTWTLAHALGRIPMVQVFLDLGGGAAEEVIADVLSTASQITVTHASPQSGFVLAF